MKPRPTLLAVFITVVVLSSSCLAKVVYIKPTGSDANNGLSWSTAKKTINGGLAISTSGDELWVAAGTYVERIVLKNGVALYGGFVGTETDRSLRNWTANVTIIDANKAGSAVVCSSGIGSTTIIDGFTIRNGWAYKGGGIYCYFSSPTITNNTIMGNSTSSNGGGIYCYSSSPAITNNTIMGNSAQDYGGGIYCWFSFPTITNNTLTANSAGLGGGIYCDESSSPTITNNTITGNIASLNSGGIYCEEFSSPAITNNTITTNSGEGISCRWYSSPTITNNTITGNSGGRISCDKRSSPTITNNIVAFNIFGIYCSDSNPTLRNNCVYGNQSYNYSGIYPGIGDFSANPMLAGWEYGNVHIQPQSPCVNAGWNEDPGLGLVDMDGQPRIQGGTVDIGADESDGTAWPAGPYIIVRVSPSGDDSNDGSTWTLAKRTVQAGIEAASLVGGDVWVAAGTYNERITLRRYVHVYGGFAGTETSRDERNWQANKTTLDGGAGGSVVTASFLGYGVSRIDGFTIRNGNASYGAGISCSYSSPTITNNTFTGNNAGYGSGIYCSHSFPTITNNTFTGNGGSVISCSYSSPTIKNNTFMENSGSGISCFSSSPTITNNTIIGNSGGISCSDSSSPTITNNTIKANNGGGILCFHSSPTITNNTITANSAYYKGGGISCSESSPIIINNIVAFNNSGIGCSDSNPKLRNNCFYGNSGYNYWGLSPGIGDFSADPLFVDKDKGNYHLTSQSPCINAGWNDAPGLPETDMDGEGRINDGVVDVGTDEYWECIAPTITADPISQTKCAGVSVTFIVAASGTEPLTYQWRKASSNILGATASAYTISSVTPGDTGIYDCVVTNSCGSATSTAALLTVANCLTIPQDLKPSSSQTAH